MTWNYLSALLLTLLPVNAGYWFGPHLGLQAGTPTTGLSIWMVGFLIARWLGSKRKDNRTAQMYITF